MAKSIDVIVIGAGASGLMAAIQAARQGASVTVLEQNRRPGRKLLATGNGRCNLTNTEFSKDCYRGEQASFHEGAFSCFSPMDTVRFFSKLGIYTVNRQGGLYPRSGQAASVLEVLQMEASSLGVKLRCNTRVTGIEPPGPGGLYKVHVDGWAFESRTVILANGSPASGIEGACGSGYVLAGDLGHRIIKPLPALVPLKTARAYPWQGVRTEGRITLRIDGREAAEDQGELQLTSYGISGIPVFQVSRTAVRALDEGRTVTAVIDFLTDFDEEGLSAFLRRRAENCPYKTKEQLLVGLFPDKLIPVLCGEEDLVRAIKAYPVKITGSLSEEQAQVCSGGVDTREICPETMESRLQPGLYFAGEMVDIDGKCGGYNLQWAWSSGACAGIHAGSAAHSAQTVGRSTNR